MRVQYSNNCAITKCIKTPRFCPEPGTKLATKKHLYFGFVSI